jgi:hypothetical protein
VSDLVTFLNARLDEDEQVARAATQGAWKLWGMEVFADQDGTSNVQTAVPVAMGRWGGAHPRTFNSSHIARHDPARVLADVAAKRAILAQYRNVSTWCWDMRTKHPGDVLHETLRHLATPYALHPDYDPTWSTHVSEPRL